MSEQTAEQTESNTADNSGFTPPATQAELNKIIADRVARERSKFADYSDLQAKAAQFDAIEKASQTDAERAAARIQELETEMESVRRDSMRLKIATEHGITDADDIDLFLTGSDEETLTKQAKRLAEREADRKKQNNVSPREGNHSSSNDGGVDRDFVRQLFAQSE